MSVRIYQLSKHLEMENKELIALLQKRGLKVDSPSNTIPNIYADSIIEELGKPPLSDLKAASTTATATVTKVKKATKTAKSEKLSESSAESSVALETEKQEAQISIQTAKPQIAIEPERKEPVQSPTPVTAKVEVKGPHAPTPPKLPAAKTPSLPSAPKTASQPQPVEVLQPATKQESTNISTHAVVPTSAPAVAATTPSIPSAAPKITGLAPKLPTPASKSAPITPKMPTSPSAIVKSNSLEPLHQETPLATPSTTPAPQSKIIHCRPPVVVRDFAQMIGLKPFRLISELMEMGIFASMNQVIDEESAIKVAAKHGYTLEIRHRGEGQQTEQKKKKEEVPVVDETQFLEPRPPVVCVLGHVDHGKTTLLDTIRKTTVAAGEAGGITQHIGAYQVEHNQHKITFLDTPGHAAFSKMRERGANITDIAILVVAADDGFMPQTDEALKFAQKANVAIVIAITKKDAKGANIDRVKQQMQQRGIAPEDWGGETLTVPVSAIKGEGIEQLLEIILLQSEMLELKANPQCAAEGTIIEAQVEQGRGVTATVIVTRGTLKPGDSIVCGPYFCKARALINEHAQNLKVATPSTPAKIIGWSEIPESGMTFKVVKNEREAKQLAEEAKTQLKKESLAQAAAKKQPTNIQELFAAISDAQKKTLKLIIKADVHGSAEALEACLRDIKSSKVDLEIIQVDVGIINKNDATLAHASNAAIVGFNVKLDQGIQALAKHHGIRIIQHNIIYELIDRVKEVMAELLEPEFKEVKVGAAEVRQVFELTKATVAGCMVTEGKILRDALARVIRAGQALHEGRFSTLKRFKDDASEVRAGYECGIAIEGFNDYQPKDIIECFQIEKIPGKL